MTEKYRVALGLEYDGSPFRGWQRQKHSQSIQENIESALSTVAAETIQTVCAGRTDAGVHATSQVLHFDTTAERSIEAWIKGTNTLLSSAIRILWAKKVPESFDARRSALRRRYRYFIYNHPIRPSLFRNQVAWFYKKLDLEKMQEASKFWLGEHDFSSFRAAECQSRTAIRRVYEIEFARAGDLISIDIEANAFLHHMIRNMMGVLMTIGANKEPSILAKEILEAKDRRAAFHTASASGLYLVKVCYPIDFGLPSMAGGLVPPLISPNVYARI